MATSIENSLLLSEFPRAQGVLLKIVEEEKSVRPPNTLIGNIIGGVMPPEWFERDAAAALESASLRIAFEHERLLCERHGEALPEGVDPTPDALARSYLKEVGLLNSGEDLSAVTSA